MSADQFAENPAIAASIDRMFDWMVKDPQCLLMVDSGPMTTSADVIAARLLGFDDQIEGEWFLPEITEVLRRALPVSAFLPDLDPTLLTPRVAEYRLQSFYGECSVGALTIAAIIYRRHQ